FDSYAVATVERDRTSEEGGRGDCFLVGSYFGVGEAAVVVDGDVDVLPAGEQTVFPRCVATSAVVVVAAAADALAGTVFDSAELLDVNVDELARPRALVADGLLEPEPAELAHPDPGQDPRHRRERHPERLRDLGRREAEPAELRDRLDPIRRSAVRGM